MDFLMKKITTAVYCDMLGLYAYTLDIIQTGCLSCWPSWLSKEDESASFFHRQGVVPQTVKTLFTLMRLGEPW